MIEDISRLIKHSGLYGLGIILSKCIGFLMIPVYTRYLSPADFGVLELLDMIIFFATSFAAMGIYGAVFRFHSAYDTVQEKKEVISTALLCVAGGSLLWSVVIILGAPTIARGVFGSTAFAPLVRIVALTFFFSNLCEVPLAYWRAEGRTKLFVFVGLGRTLLGALALAYSLVIAKAGLQGAVYANCLTSAIGGLTLFGVVLSGIPKRIIADKLRPMLAYGIPVVAWDITMFVLTFSDRFFLRYYASLTEVGVYGLGYKLAGVVALIVNVPFLTAWQWQQFDLAKRENAKQIYAKVETYLLVASIAVGLAVAVLAKDVLRILTPPGYWAAARVVPLIALSYIVSNVRQVVVTGILIRQATYYLTVIAASCAVANLALNFIFIPRYRAMGAAVATVVTFALLLFLCFAAAQRIYPVPYEYGRNALVLGWATLVYLLSLVPSLGLIGSIVMHMLVLTLFYVGCFWLLDPQDRGTFQKLGLAFVQDLRRGWVRAE